MTSFGRGRGWSIQSQNPNKEQGLRRPGNATCGNNFVKDIIDKIVTYDVHEHISPQLIQEITDLLTSAVNKDSLKYYSKDSSLIGSRVVISSFFNTKLQISGIHAIIFGNKLHFMTHLPQKSE